MGTKSDIKNGRRQMMPDCRHHFAASIFGPSFGSSFWSHFLVTVLGQFLVPLIFIFLPAREFPVYQFLYAYYKCVYPLYARYKHVY